MIFCCCAIWPVAVPDALLRAISWRWVQNVEAPISTMSTTQRIFVDVVLPPTWCRNSALELNAAPIGTPKILAVAADCTVSVGMPLWVPGKQACAMAKVVLVQSMLAGSPDLGFSEFRTRNSA